MIEAIAWTAFAACSFMAARRGLEGCGSAAYWVAAMVVLALVAGNIGTSSADATGCAQIGDR